MARRRYYSPVLACETRDRICQSGKQPRLLLENSIPTFPTRTRKHVDRAKGALTILFSNLPYKRMRIFNGENANPVSLFHQVFCTVNSKINNFGIFFSRPFKLLYV